MRLLICAGGTGGGVYPALTVLQHLGSEADSVLWVGGEGGMEAELVKRANVPFTTIPAAGVHGVELKTLPGNLLRLSRGFFESRRILHRFQPDALLFTGGYVAVPMALAGRSIPTLVYVPDIEPGLALKAVSRFADRIAVTTEDSRPYFNNPKRVVVTGYPTRPGFAQWTKEKALQTLGLSSDLPVLLVLGGSKGSRPINRALLPILPDLVGRMQIVHVTGNLDWPEIEAARNEMTAEVQTGYHAYPYLHEEMGAAFAAADLVVSRSGASTLGELPLFGLPAILVPYPYAWRYQKVNAAYLAERGAAIFLEESRLAGELLSTISGLLDNHERLNGMRRAMRSLARPNAGAEIAGLLREMASGKGTRRN